MVMVNKDDMIRDAGNRLIGRYVHYGLGRIGTVIGLCVAPMGAIMVDIEPTDEGRIKRIPLLILMSYVSNRDELADVWVAMLADIVLHLDLWGED